MAMKLTFRVALMVLMFLVVAQAITAILTAWLNQPSQALKTTSGILGVVIVAGAVAAGGFLAARWKDD